MIDALLTTLGVLVAALGCITLVLTSKVLPITADIEAMQFKFTNDLALNSRKLLVMHWMYQMSVALLLMLALRLNEVHHAIDNKNVKLPSENNNCLRIVLPSSISTVVVVKEGNEIKVCL